MTFSGINSKTLSHKHTNKLFFFLPLHPHHHSTSHRHRRRRRTLGCIQMPVSNDHKVATDNNSAGCVALLFFCCFFLTSHCVKLERHKRHWSFFCSVVDLSANCSSTKSRVHRNEPNFSASCHFSPFAPVHHLSPAPPLGFVLKSPFVG